MAKQKLNFDSYNAHHGIQPSFEETHRSPQPEIMSLSAQKNEVQKTSSGQVNWIYANFRELTPAIQQFLADFFNDVTTSPNYCQVKEIVWKTGLPHNLVKQWFMNQKQIDSMKIEQRVKLDEFFADWNDHELEYKKVSQTIKCSINAITFWIQRQEKQIACRNKCESGEMMELETLFQHKRQLDERLNTLSSELNVNTAEMRAWLAESFQYRFKAEKQLFERQVRKLTPAKLKSIIRPPKPISQKPMKKIIDTAILKTSKNCRTSFEDFDVQRELNPELILADYLEMKHKSTYQEESNLENKQLKSIQTKHEPTSFGFDHVNLTGFQDLEDIDAGSLVPLDTNFNPYQYIPNIAIKKETHDWSPNLLDYGSLEPASSSNSSSNTTPVGDVLTSMDVGSHGNRNQLQQWCNQHERQSLSSAHVKAEPPDEFPEYSSMSGYYF